MHIHTHTHTFPSCEVCVYEGGLEDGKTGNYGVRVVEDVCQQTQRVQVLVHITPIIKGKRKMHVYCDCSLPSSHSSLSSVLLSLKRSSSMRMALPSIMQCRSVLIPPNCATMKSQRSLCNVFFPAAIGPSIAPESMRCGTTWFDQKPMPMAMLIPRRGRGYGWQRIGSGAARAKG